MIFIKNDNVVDKYFFVGYQTSTIAPLTWIRVISRSLIISIYTRKRTKNVNLRLCG